MMLRDDLNGAIDKICFDDVGKFVNFTYSLLRRYEMMKIYYMHGVKTYVLPQQRLVYSALPWFY